MGLRGAKSKIPIETINRIRHMYHNENLTQMTLAVTFDLSQGTVCRILNKKKYNSGVQLQSYPRKEGV